MCTEQQSWGWRVQQSPCYWERGEGELAEEGGVVVCIYREQSSQRNFLVPPSGTVSSFRNTDFGSNLEGWTSSEARCSHDKGIGSTPRTWVFPCAPSYLSTWDVDASVLGMSLHWGGRSTYALLGQVAEVSRTMGRCQLPPGSLGTLVSGRIAILLSLLTPLPRLQYSQISL